jgi:hypothetical protein
MADMDTPSLTSIAAGMMAKAAQQRKQSTGIVGGMIESITGQIEEYNNAVGKHAALTLKFKKIQQELNQSEVKRQMLQAKLRKGLITDKKELAATVKEVQRLRKSETELTDQHALLNVQLSKSHSNIHQMTGRSGKLNNAVGLLAAKVGGAATAFFSWGEAFEQIDRHLVLGAKQARRTADVTSGYWSTLNEVRKAQSAWGDTLVSTTWEMTKLGINADETHKILTSMTDGLRFSSNNMDELRASSQQATLDIGYMSQLLRTNTDELANATIDASKRFGKSTTAMADDLAGMYVSIQQVKQGSRDTVVDFRDLTRATLEAQSGFQGYNLNLRDTSRVLATVVARAQEQGATYEMAQKGAEGLVGVLTGSKAPDWAKYMAGQDLRREVRDALKGVESALDENGNLLEGQAEKVREMLIKNGVAGASELTNMQVANLQDLANNWRKYGELSSANMTQEMLGGTRTGMKAMLEVMQKTSQGPEMREVLKQVWGLDDQAASAAVLTLRKQGGFEQLMDDLSQLQTETTERAPPTVKDLRQQSERYVEAISLAEQGIRGSIKNVVDALKANPLLTGILGTLGAVASGISQLVTMGVAAKVLSGGGPLNIGGKLKSLFDLKAVGPAAGPRLGAGRAAGRAIKGAASSLRGVAGRAIEGVRAPGAIRAAPRAIAQGLKTGAQLGAGAVKTVVSTSMSVITGPFKYGARVLKGSVGLMRAALQGGAGGIAKFAGGVGIAAVAGVAFGTWLRTVIPGLDDFTEGLINSSAKLLGLEHAMDAEETARVGFVKAMEGNTEAAQRVRRVFENVQKAATGQIAEGSAEMGQAIRFLKGAKQEDLRAYAERIKEATGQSVEETMSRLTALQQQTASTPPAARNAGGRGAGTQAAAKGPTGAPGATTAPTGAPREKPVVTVTKLTAEQKAAVSQQVATDLAPEVKGMATNLFGQMAQQSQEYHEGVLKASEYLWRQYMPERVNEAWMQVTTALTDQIALMPMTAGQPVVTAPRAQPEARARRPEPQRGRAQQPGRARIGPDGSISVNVIIPRDALDQSALHASAYTE